MSCKPLSVKKATFTIVHKHCYSKPEPCPEWNCDPCPPVCSEQSSCVDPDWTGLSNTDDVSNAWLVTCDEDVFHVVG